MVRGLDLSRPKRSGVPLSGPAVSGRETEGVTPAGVAGKGEFLPEGPGVILGDSGGGNPRLGLADPVRGRWGEGAGSLR